MAEFFDRLEDEHIDFIERQPMFFVATAAADGRINLSPKGLDTFRVIDHATAGYLDLTGSGNETAAHIKRDGRITMMFNSFDKKPLIMRLYGRGRVAGPGTPEFEKHVDRFAKTPGARQIIFIDIDSVQTSCGYAVPEMSLTRPRPILTRHLSAMGEEGVREYHRLKNVLSIDGFETGLAASEKE